MDGKFSDGGEPKAESSFRSPTRKSLTRSERIRSSVEIQGLFQRGARVSARGMRVIYAPNGLTYTRVVVIPAKGFQNAVTRNRCRRQTKEAFRELKPRLTPGYDVAIVSYPGTNDYHVRAEQLKKLLGQAGILPPPHTKEF